MTINAPTVAPQPVGLSLGDIYYVLFRHKWKLLLCTTAAVLAALSIERLSPPPYQSEAKLYVRYVLGDKAFGAGMTDSAAKSPDQRGETIMNSEVEILTSVDLARQVAEAIGPDKILAKYGGGKDLSQAIGVIKGGIQVAVPPASSVIHVIFRHPDPDIVRPVLRELLDRYLKLHVETHTANGMVGDFLTQETDQLRSRLLQTEEELRRALNKANVISLDDAKKSYAEQMTSIRRDVYNTEAELALRASALEEITKRIPAQTEPVAVETPVPVEILTEYRSVANQVDLLQRMQEELLTQFTPQNPRVVEVRTQLEAETARRDKLQQRYPRLLQIGVASDHGQNTDAMNTANLATAIASLKAKIKVLNAQYDALRGEVTKLEQMEGTIVELRRKKELEEANYRYYAASLEQARINETLGNGRVSNIIQIQKPSPPYSDRSKLNKMIVMVLGGGIAAALAWVFLIELYLDRSIKRPVDIERTVPAPLMIAIPAVKKHLLLAGGNGNGTHAVNGSAVPDRPLLPYHETLRDRLISYFESINLNHKPKLVAVAGLTPQAGVTTTAAGLARSLSETGEGNVLLVDMNVDQGMAQQFMHGRAVCGLDEILNAPDSAHVDQNLYIVAENSHSDRLSRNMPQRFTKLVPKLKASDFDYIIFDMPPISQISITPRLAGFMDMILLVIESEKTDRDLVQRVTQMLSDSRAQVGVVLNKTRSYVPLRLHHSWLAN